MVDLPADVSDVTSDFRKVCVDLDGYLMRLTGGGIVQMDLSQLIVDQRGAVAPEAANIGAVVMQRFHHALGGGIVAEYSDRAGASRQEIDPLPAPHRKEVRRLLMGDFDGVEAGQGGQPDGAGAPPSVV